MAAARKKAGRQHGAEAVPFKLAGWNIEPGTIRTLEIRLGELYNSAPIGMRTVVIHGRRAGPRLWLSGGVHGDELAGLIAVRTVLQRIDPERLHGTVVGIPCVNELGALHLSREFPDGRDLNRCFPGSRTGTLASRVARAFLREVALRCTHGIDVHTAGGTRDNLPQIRANLDDAETRRLAEAFGTRVILHANLRDGSLRQAASARGVTVLLFEGGQPLRHEPHVIESATRGIFRVMATLGMIEPKVKPAKGPMVAWESFWIRTPRSGYFVAQVDLGDKVRAGQPVGFVSLRPHDDLGRRRIVVRATEGGIVVGIQRLPLVHVGDPLVHVAEAGSRHRSGKKRASGGELVAD